MGGAPPGAGRITELSDWLFAMPPLPLEPATDTEAVVRGKLVFDDSAVGCATCHNGEALTNHALVSVGTGEVLKVPTLVGISTHAPFMHSGCAPTLRDRFGACGGGDAHGRTSHLTPQQLDDLIKYLETL
jgi:mono/diheme cytochrome c family protein